MTYLEERRQQKLIGKPPKETKRYVIPRQSEKRKVEDRELKKLFVQRFLIDPTCQLKSPVCTGIAQCQDHLQKTSPKNRLMPENLEMSCFACNGWKETAEGQQWAKQTGNHISRFKKLTK